MPNRFSHSVVLAHYATLGIIDFPNGQDIEFLSSVPRRGRATSSARDSYRTGSSRESTYTTSSNRHSTSQSLQTPHSQTAQAPASFSRKKSAVRLQPSNESIQNLVEPEEKPLSPIDNTRLDTHLSQSTIILPSIPSQLEVRQSTNEDTTEDNHMGCSTMALGVNCFYPSVAHVKPSLPIPSLPRVSTPTTTPLTGPRASIPITARSGPRSVHTASSATPSQLNDQLPATPSTATTLINTHQPQQRPPPPSRPDSRTTQIFDPLPPTADFSDLPSPTCSTSPDEPNARNRRFSFDTLSSLSSLSLDTDAPTLTPEVKSPTPPYARSGSSCTTRYSFWDNLGSCGDTLAMAFPPPGGTRDSIDDYASYPPDIPTTRRVYPSGTSQSTPTVGHNHRAAMLTSPLPIPLPGQRIPQEQFEAKKNWFGVASVLKKRNDGTVRNSGGLVIGARS